MEHWEDFKRDTEIVEFNRIGSEHRNYPVISTENGNIPILLEGATIAIKYKDIFRTYTIIEGEVIKMEVDYKLKPTK